MSFSNTLPISLYTELDSGDSVSAERTKAASTTAAILLKAGVVSRALACGYEGAAPSRAAHVAILRVWHCWLVNGSRSRAPVPTRKLCCRPQECRCMESERERECVCARGRGKIESAKCALGSGTRGTSRSGASRARPLRARCQAAHTCPGVRTRAPGALRAAPAALSAHSRTPRPLRSTCACASASSCCFRVHISRAA